MASALFDSLFDWLYTACVFLAHSLSPWLDNSTNKCTDYVCNIILNQGFCYFFIFNSCPPGVCFSLDLQVS